VLHEARQIAEPEVDDLDPLILHDLQHVGRGAISHDSSWCSGTEQPGLSGRQAGRR
jgi:hypothetical protein